MNNQLVPFHLSICVNDLQEAHKFYGGVLQLELRRTSPISAHYNFGGSQLTLHEVKEYSAQAIQRRVESDDVPVPHFGITLPMEQYLAVLDNIKRHHIKFVRDPGIRFKGLLHAQYVFFIHDPSGNGIEIKSFIETQDSWL